MKNSKSFQQQSGQHSVQIYPSKIDLWIMAIIIGAGVAMAWAAFEVGLSEEAGQTERAIIVGSFVLYCLIIFGCAYPVSYVVGNGELLIRCGLTRSRIGLDSIDAVTPTRDPTSAPALSLDRLRIDYRRKGKIRHNLISPDDKTGFMMEVARLVDRLELKGEQLVRTAQKANE